MFNNRKLYIQPGSNANDGTGDTDTTFAYVMILIGIIMHVIQN